MAVGDGVLYSPPADAAAPPVLSRLALAAADAVMCVWFASAWVHFAGYATFAVSITHAICAEHCHPTEDTAWAVATFAALFSLFLCTIIVRLLCFCIDIEDPGAEDDDDKVPASPRSSEAAILEVFPTNTVIVVGSLVAMAFFFLVPAGFLVKGDSPIKGSREERIGSAMVNAGSLGMGALFCLIVIPSLALKVWRMRRSGWRWGSAFEGKPSRGESTARIGKETQLLTIC